MHTALRPAARWNPATTNAIARVPCTDYRESTGRSRRADAQTRGFKPQRLISLHSSLSHGKFHFSGGSGDSIWSRVSVARSTTSRRIGSLERVEKNTFTFGFVSAAVFCSSTTASLPDFNRTSDPVG